MKFLSSQFSYFFQSKNTRRNVRILINFILFLIFLIIVYSIAFHYISAAEGKNHSWITGFYWTLTVMTTLGFGDITFSSDLGRFFTMIVLLSGVVLLLVLLPFTFIQFFYAPWMEAERKSRTPRELPVSMKDHIIITAFNPVSSALIEQLQRFNHDYTVLVDDVQKALELYDMGYKASVGYIDDPQTYQLMRASQAAMVVAVNSDEVNTNVAFTVREISSTVPVICSADSQDSVDILDMAGATVVLQLADMLGQSLARKTIGGERRANIIGTVDDLVIAEAPAMRTPLAGKTLIESRLRQIIGVSVIGIWERGKFFIPRPETVIANSTVLVLAGSQAQMDKYEEFMCIYQTSASPVIIIGAGRVGRAVAENFHNRNMEYVMIDKNANFRNQHNVYICGNAADIKIMEEAGIREAPAAILTTHDDATNIYLTKYCRSLRPDMQIISRCNVERNVSTLHRAGADFVMSYATLSATTIYNYLKNSQILMLAEGLDMFKVSMPESLAGLTLAESQIRQKTDCNVVAVKTEAGMEFNPDPHKPLPTNSYLLLIGNIEAEKRFFHRFMD